MSERRSVRIRNCVFNVIMDRDIDFFGRHWDALENGEEEPATFQMMESLINKDTTVIEVGAWIGTMALYEARLGKIVYAFEADPVALKSLQNNVAQNPDMENIRVVGKVVSESSGRQKLYSEHSGNNSASSIYKVDGKTVWEIEAVNLDDFIVEQGIEGPIFLNVDIEGGEYAVLPALKIFSMNQKIQMCLSLHPHLLAQSVEGNGLLAKIRRRLVLLWKNYKVLRVSTHFSRMLDANLLPTSKSAVLWDLLIRGKLDVDKKELFFLTDTH